MTPSDLPILAAFGVTLAVFVATRLTAYRLYRRTKVDLVRTPTSNPGLRYSYTGLPMVRLDLARPRGLGVRFERPTGLIVALIPAAGALLSGRELSTADWFLIALSTLMLIPGVVAEIRFIASGRYSEPAVSAETAGLRINRLFRTTFLRWNEVDAIDVDPPQVGGYLQSRKPATLRISAGDGRSWRFGVEELAAEPGQMAAFADVALARAYSPAALRKG